MFVSVVGASGAIGQSTVKALLQAGHRVRAVGRSAEKLRACFQSATGQLEHQVADVTTAEGCAAAASSVDALVFTPGLPQSNESVAQYPALTLRMVEASAAAKVGAFLLISNTYAYGIPNGESVTEDSPLRPVGPKGRYRLEQEKVVLAADAPGSMRTGVLRLPLFFGPGADNSVLSMAAASIVRGQPAMLLAPIDVSLEWVVTSDVGPVIARLLSNDALAGVALNMGGSGRASQRELVQLMMEAGQQVPLRVLPNWVQRVLGLLVPALRDMRDVKYLMETPLVLSEQRLLAALSGPVQHTPLRDAAREWVQLLSARLEGARVTSDAG